MGRGDLRAAVVGGSLGGLTAALLLRDLGADVTVYERSPAELEQRGAGIGFLPASARYLVERAGRHLDDISIETAFIRTLHRDGSVRFEEHHPYRFTSWNTLYRNLLAEFGRDRYLLDHEVAERRVEGPAAELTFASGSVVSADLAVFADGVGSPARAQLLPDVRAAYSGYVAWRGMVPEADLDPATAAGLGDAITYYVYANSHVLVYPIPGPTGALEPGQRLVNTVWYRNYLEGDDLHDVLTDTTGVRRELSLPPGSVRPEHAEEVRAVAAARLPPQIAEVVARTEQPFLQVVYDIEVPRMAFGRGCLIGDAAFAARPHAAAGTAKAAADAWALAGALERTGDVEAALRAWEPGQLRLGRELLARTRRIGRRSQVDGTWQPGDPELIFGLEGPGR